MEKHQIIRWGTNIFEVQNVKMGYSWQACHVRKMIALHFLNLGINMDKT